HQRLQRHGEQGRIVEPEAPAEDVEIGERPHQRSEDGRAPADREQPQIVGAHAPGAPQRGRHRRTQHQEHGAEGCIDELDVERGEAEDEQPHAEQRPGHHIDEAAEPAGEHLLLEEAAGEDQSARPGEAEQEIVE
ncbi:hypothetical protein QU38_00705, partial [Staphylococcus aureus]